MLADAPAVSAPAIPSPGMEHRTESDHHATGRRPVDWKSLIGLLMIGLAFGTGIAVAQDPQTETEIRKRLEAAERMPKMFGLITKRENLVITQRAQSEPLTISLQTKKDDDRNVFSVCYPDCGRIQLQLLTDKGEEVNERTDPNSVRIIERTGREGSYVVKVSLLECPRERCALGVSIWVKE